MGIAWRFLLNNSFEWVVLDTACHLLRLVNVSLFCVLNKADLDGIIKRAEARYLFTEPDIMESIGRAPDDEKRRYTTGQVGSSTFAVLVKEGGDRTEGEVEEVYARLDRVTPDDLATMVFTSGTTADFKGVMLTHANLLANLTAVEEVEPVAEDDSALSFLPVCHMFERMITYGLIDKGVPITFSRGKEHLVEDLAYTRPTIVALVPLVLDRIYTGVLAKVSGAPAWRRWLFHWAMRTGSRARVAGKSGGLSLWLADRLVFKKIRAVAGGRIRLLLSGGAPHRLDTLEFFSAAGMPVLQGYGLTETSPVIAVNTVRHCRLGSVGKPLPGVELRIGPDDEILVRGANVTPGYLDDAEATKGLLEDGWLHTGDYGRLDEDGFLFVEWRKKQLIVLATGKNVSPVRVEAALEAQTAIHQAIIFGDGQHYVTTVVVPALELQGRGAEDAVSKAIEAAGRNLSGFEVPKRFLISAKAWTVDNGYLTPTLKLRRGEIKDLWLDRVNELYTT